jgi:hypothetical protein
MEVAVSGEAPIDQRSSASAAPSGWSLFRRASATSHTGSLAQRMMMIAAVWISILLLTGGFALDRR